MHRKSKTKFKLSGHTLPGTNQRSEGNTDLADGRSKSSAFQAKEDKTTPTLGDSGNDWEKIKPAVERDISASTQKEGQSGWNFALQEISKAVARKKAARKAEEPTTPSEKLDEQLDKDVSEVDETEQALDAYDEKRETAENQGKHIDDEGFYDYKSDPKYKDRFA